MSDSILDTIKQLLGIEAEDTAFDTDVIVHINSALMTLNQLGVGPSAAFSIQDKDDIWEDFLEKSTDLEAVKTYIYLKVRTVFDPPSSSAVLEAMNRSISELEWRLNVQAEEGGVTNV